MVSINRIRARRWAIGALIGVALFGIAGAFGLPAATRWAIETVASRELGRPLTVGKISANPFTLRITAHDLALAEAPGGDAAPFVQVARITLDLSLASLWHRAPVLDALQVDGVRARIVRSGLQRFNFSDIVDRLQAAPKTSAEPARFSLNNIEVTNSEIRLDDRVLGSQHAITELRIGVPFISSLPHHADIRVQPAFAARINGTPVDLRGETLPFDDALESVLHVKLDGLDLPTYLGYSPVRLNFAVPRGKLDTDLRIAFRRPAPATGARPARPAELVISGSAAVREFALTGTDPQDPLVSWQRLGVRIAEFVPLGRRLAFDEVTLAAPQFKVQRAAGGDIDWLTLAQAPAQREPGTPPASTASPANPTATPPFALSIARLAVSAGRLHFIDASLGRFEQTLEGIAIEATGLSTAPGSAAQPVVPARIKASGQVVPQGSLALDGEVALAPLAGTLAYRADDVQLRGLARLIGQFVNGTLDGSSSVRGQLRFAQVDGALELALRGLQIEGRALQLRGPDGSGAALDIAAVKLDGGELDVGRRSLRIASLALDAPRISVRRLPDGSLGWQQLQRAAPAAAAGRATEARPKVTAPWQVALDELTIARGQVRFDDESVQPAVRIALNQIQGSVRNLSADGSTRAELALRTRIGSDGSLVLNGGVRWDRLLASLRFAARNLDAAAARGYLAQFVNATLVSGEVSSRGSLTLAQPEDGPLRMRFDGDLRLANLHATDASGSDDLLRWQTLAVDRLAVELGRGAPQVDVGTVALDEFYARVILSEAGRLNLADLFQRAPTEGEAEAPAARDPAAASAAAEPVPPTPASAAAPSTDAAPARVRIDRIQITGGNVNFTDNFVRPNYTANLTDLAGSVTALANDAADPATLVLAGRVDKDAPLSINGRLNPLTPQLQLDIAASTKGVDLPRLTPYSTKYAGYPITKGKLSLDLRYQIEDGKLTASNHLFLDQLTFGERVDSPTATKLPVLLAVALLKNSRGEIDINLPIAGSLDDPQFSLGGIIVKVIVNLLGKVVTAPFSLLAAVFGGGEELGQIDFAGGSAVLEPGQIQRLQTLARALNDRPALRLDVIGRADAGADTAGLRDAEFDARLRAARVRQLVRDGGTSIDPAQVTIPAAERATLIAAVYDAEPIADKPRTLGIARRLPAPEMEQRIRAHLALKPVDLRALANARAAAVRDWLEIQGKVERERMFVVEPRIADGSATAGGADRPIAAGPATRVEFSLK
ncbi:MAG: DUF748 domain-containing protein [Burkholderiaceae bacterium]|nr:DUF748 domain-containing protein [Burkholderiaceae bacterium]